MAKYRETSLRWPQRLKIEIDRDMNHLLGGNGGDEKVCVHRDPKERSASERSQIPTALEAANSEYSGS